MTSALRHRPSVNGHSGEKGASFASFPAPATSSNGPRKLSSQASLRRKSPNDSLGSQSRSNGSPHNSLLNKRPRYKSQYPLDSPDLHVEYILVASFHVDRGPIMEHQYPSPISGDEHMLAELMLPDQTHVRSQDWTIFFLHKDASEDNENADSEQQNGAAQASGEQAGQAEDQDGDDPDEEEENPDGPPLMYVLNLVNTKQDTSVKRYVDPKFCVEYYFTSS